MTDFARCLSSFSTLFIYWFDRGSRGHRDYLGREPLFRQKFEFQSCLPEALHTFFPADLVRSWILPALQFEFPGRKYCPKRNSWMDNSALRFFNVWF